MSLLKRMIGPAYTLIGRRYCRKRTEWSFLKQKFQRINERPVEYGFVFRSIAATCPKSVLDVGHWADGAAFVAANLWPRGDRNGQHQGLLA